jgi:hypothetical protein
MVMIVVEIMGRINTRLRGITRTAGRWDLYIKLERNNKFYRTVIKLSGRTLMEIRQKFIKLCKNLLKTPKSHNFIHKISNAITSKTLRPNTGFSTTHNLKPHKKTIL